MTPNRSLPPRRLLAVAAAAILVTSPVMAAKKTKTPSRTSRATNTTVPVCPLGSFQCPPTPDNYAMCRPNAMLDFYDPTLSHDATQRDEAKTYIDAATVDSSDQTFYKLDGDADHPDVRVQRADQLLHAYHVTYNDQTTDYDAVGNVRYQEAGQLLAAEHMKGNTDASHAVGDDVRYQMLTSRGNGVAARGEMVDDQHSHYTRATYSTCDVGHHVWELRTKDLKTDKTTGVGTAKGATMRFGHVPFLYLPYFTFPLDDRRKSGFLFPLIGSSTHSGLEVGTPYYFNLAPNYDATLEPRYYTERGAMLAGEFRYLFPGSSGQLNVEYLPSDRGNSKDESIEQEKGNNRWLLKFADTTQLGQGWLFSTSLNRTSDRNYLRDFGNDLYTSSIGTLSSSAYVYGNGKWWSASFGADDYQNVDPYLPDTVVQYTRLPRFTYNIDLPIDRHFTFGMDNEAVAFRKDEVIDGKRVDLYPYLQADYRGASWFVKPRLAYRYTAYELEGAYDNYNYNGRIMDGTASPFTAKSPSRSLPIASLDTGLIFDRATNLFGSDYTQTLEPRLYYLYVPYRDQDRLPLFDTTLMSFDYWQLFTPNRFSGADRQMDANNLTAALTSRLLDDNGVERISGSLGQIRYLSKQRVQLPNGPITSYPTTDYIRSDYVAQFNALLGDQWRLNSSYQWSPNTRQTDLGVMELQHRIKTDGIFNLSYRFRRVPGLLPVAGDSNSNELLKLYDASVVYPVSERWRVLGRWSYSVKDKRTVEALAGVEYDSCCVAVRLVGRHYVRSAYYDGSNPDISNAVMFELEFKGLGSSSPQVEELLHRGILGYQ